LHYICFTVSKQPNILSALPNATPFGKRINAGMPGKKNAKIKRYPAPVYRFSHAVKLKSFSENMNIDAPNKATATIRKNSPDPNKSLLSFLNILFTSP